MRPLTWQMASILLTIEGFIVKNASYDVQIAVLGSRGLSQHKTLPKQEHKHYKVIKKTLEPVQYFICILENKKLF